MSESILFRGAYIRHFDWRRKDESPAFCRIHLTADYTAPVQEQMGWDIGDGLSSAKLKGELTAHHAVLTPADHRLSGHEIQIGLDQLADFQVVEMRDEDGESTGRELRFVARSSQAGICAILESFLDRIGTAAFVLKASYDRPAVQTRMDLSRAEDDRLHGDDSKVVVDTTNHHKVPAEGETEIILAADKVCEARLIVREVPDGWSASSEARIRTRGELKAIADAPTLPAPSEREAIQTAAGRIRAFAMGALSDDNEQTKLSQPSRKAVLGLVAACDKHIYSEGSVQ